MSRPGERVHFERLATPLALRNEKCPFFENKRQFGFVPSLFFIFDVEMNPNETSVVESGVKIDVKIGAGKWDRLGP